MASRANRTVRLRKTNCSARFALRVPKNMNRVNTPHSPRYTPRKWAFAASARPILGISRIATRVSQKEP